MPVRPLSLPARLALSLVFLSAVSGLAAGATPQPGAAQELPTAADEFQTGAWGENWRGKVVVLEVKGTIVGEPFSDMPERVGKALDKADLDGARLAVLEIDSPGGEVGACDKLSKRIFDAKTPVVSLVLHKAVSGGAMLASAANELVMTRGSRIGDIQPMAMSLTGGGQGMDDRTAEKIEVDIRTIMKVYAEHYGRPVALVEAMVSRSSSLYQVKFAGGATEYLTGNELHVIEGNIEKGRETRRIEGTKLLKAEGKLLELSAQEAVEYGLASEVADSPEAFYKARGIDGADIVRPTVPEGSLELKKLIPSIPDLGLPVGVLVLLGVFLVVGIVGVVTEFHAPGAVIPLAVGIIGFVCFFSLLFMYGRGSSLGIAVFLVGIALLIVEIMILPGFGITGVLGMLGILTGLLLAFTPDWSSEYMTRFMWYEVGSFTLLLFIGLVGAVAAVWLVSEYGARIPMLGKLFLTQSQEAGVNPYPEAVAPEPADSARLRARSLVGRVGVAETMLRPAGKVRLEGGELLDVVTDGVYVEAGRRVKVLEAAPNRIVVTAER